MTITIRIKKKGKGKSINETLPLPDNEKKRRARERSKDTQDRQRDNKRRLKQVRRPQEDTLEFQNQDLMRLAHGITEEEESERSDPFVRVSRKQIEALLSMFDSDGNMKESGDSEETMQVRLSVLNALLGSPNLKDDILLAQPVDEEKGEFKKPACSKGSPWRKSDGTFGDKDNATSWSLQNIKGGGHCRSGARKANPSRATKLPCGRKGKYRCKDGTNKNTEPAKRE